MYVTSRSKEKKALTIVDLLMILSKSDSGEGYLREKQKMWAFRPSFFYDLNPPLGLLIYFTFLFVVNMKAVD